MAMGEKTILASVSFDVPCQGVFSLFGPSGVGKSTLLRTVSGLNEASPNLRVWGRATYLGRPLGDSERPSMVMQSAKLMTATVLRNLLHDVPERSALDMTQQRELATRILSESGLEELIPKLYRPVLELNLYQNRHLSIARICAANPRMICLDEPAAGLAAGDAEKLLRFVAMQSQRRSVLIVLHNQQHAKLLGGKAALLAGGVIQEQGEATSFLQAAVSEAGKAFARTGSCSVPSPDAAQEDLDPAVTPVSLPADRARGYVSDSFGPRGFLWLIKGVLAGTPRPGVFYDEEYDVKALRRVGVSHLVSLTEYAPKEAQVDTGLLQKYEIQHSQFPIVDMGAPSLEEARKICQHLDALIERDQVVAVHCRAGMGRTGTVLAMYTIWKGKDAITALEDARKIEPRWVQSDAQVRFLEDFEQFLVAQPVGGERCVG